MIVFLILAWLHSSACVDCTVLSLQMTSIWTVSIWHAFIYVGSRKAIFRWVSHFPSSFVDLTDQTLLWSFDPFAKCTLNAVFFFFFNFRHLSQKKSFRGYLGAHDSTPYVCSACYLNERGQGMQTLHPSHYWREFLIPPTFDVVFRTP